MLLYVEIICNIRLILVGVQPQLMSFWFSLGNKYLLSGGMPASKILKLAFFVTHVAKQHYISCDDKLMSRLFRM